MSVLTVTINDPSPAFDKKSSEVAYLEQVLTFIGAEIRRGNGTVTSGTVPGPNHTAGSGPQPSVSLASWTYTPAASHP